MYSFVVVLSTLKIKKRKNTMSKKKLETYIVSCEIEISTDIEIKADSLQDALDQSKDLKIHDFIKIYGNYNDGKIKEITGVFK